MPGPAKQFDPEAALMDAINVFSTHGYNGTSLSLLTEAMGIGKKSLYDTFGDKRSLFFKAIRAYTRKSISDMTAVLFDPNSDSLVQNLQTLFSIWIQSHSEPQSKGCLLGTCMADFDDADIEAAETLREGLTLVEDLLTDAMEQASANGELKLSAAPRDVARTLLCISQGVALVGRISTSEEVIRSALEVTQKQILRT